MEREQEVRFAVVMYGGVSLAIYINGVAQELFRLVRATAPAHMYSQVGRPDAAGQASTTTTSSSSGHASASTASWAGCSGTRRVDAAEPDHVRTRFVVDIISGTSAGGINGVLLALALARQKDFRLSAELWREVADIDELLREEESFEGLPEGDAAGLGVAAQRLPPLLQGARGDGARWRPAESPDDPWRPAFVEQLDLAVTATDLAGVPLPVRLTEQRSIDERVHRKVLPLLVRHGGDHRRASIRTSEDLDLDARLRGARARRRSRSAFEPVLLKDLEALERARGAVPDSERFFAGDTPPARRDVAFADGGYLDNKPFSYATEALRSRRADVPVKRKLALHRAAPGHGAASSARGRPTSAAASATGPT